MCFGSNEAGIHGAGAARTALMYHGAVMGAGFGHVGNSFAIPTKDWDIRTLSLSCVEFYVCRFVRYAMAKKHIKFQVTQIGCGLAGLRVDQIAPMFRGAPENCYFDTAWKDILGNQCNYWGTFP